jgi:hypothetical protein
MSIVNLARRKGRFIILIGLDKDDIGHLVAGDVVLLEAKPDNNLPDLALFAGETTANLEEALETMGRPEDDDA